MTWRVPAGTEPRDGAVPRALLRLPHRLRAAFSSETSLALFAEALALVPGEPIGRFLVAARYQELVNQGIRHQADRVR